ncbi:MAG: hypothetical protein ABI134_17935 [Byssovorax sp.]
MSSTTDALHESPSHSLDPPLRFDPLRRGVRRYDARARRGARAHRACDRNLVSDCNKAGKKPPKG